MEVAAPFCKDGLFQLLSYNLTVIETRIADEALRRFHVWRKRSPKGPKPLRLYSIRGMKNNVCGAVIM